MRVAESVAAIRKHRGLTQDALAEVMKTSQAAIARIEGAQENITLRTLEKAVKALDGCLHLSIAPLELNLPVMPDWWEISAFAALEPYSCRLMAIQKGDPIRVAIGWEASAPATIDPATRVTTVLSTECVTAGPSVKGQPALLKAGSSQPEREAV